MFKKTTFVAFICILISITLSCKKNIEPDIFYTYFQSDPGKLDPFYSTDVISGKVLSKMCDTLFNINHKGLLEKNLVEKYTFTEKELKCTLKQNLKFSNGTPLTSEDVKFSFYRIRDSVNPTSPRKWLFQNIDEIKIIDSYNFNIKLKSVSSTFLYLLTMPTGYIISKNAYQKNKEILGSGPFFLKEWKNDQHLLLLKNNHYHSTMPHIRGIMFRIIPEDLTARSEFLSNTLDYVEVPFLEGTSKMSDKYKVINAPQLSVYYIALNNTKKPFSNKIFRKALNIAVDRKAVMKTLFKDRFKLAAGPVPPGLGLYKSKVKPIAYDSNKARQMFKDLGVLGKEFHLNIKADHQVSLIAQLIQRYLEKAGLKITIHEMEWAALKATTINAKYQMALFSWWADYPEAENFIIPLFHSANKGSGGNRAFYANPKVDKLIAKAQKTVNDRKRFDIYSKIEELIVDDAPWIFLWYGDRKIMLNPRVKQYVAYPIYNGMKGTDIILN